MQNSNISPIFALIAEYGQAAKKVADLTIISVAILTPTL
jgi:hypothetical protein